MATATVTVPQHGILRRPKATTGVWSWFTTVDHKKLGILYIVTASAFFLLGGLEALLVRLQLAAPNGTILSASQYNQAFTMHGTTMIFLVVMPLAAGFGNYLVPLQIGARDVAFPRINALGYWAFLSGGLFLYSSIFLGGLAAGGWFGYAPLSSGNNLPGAALTGPFLGTGMSYWAIGLIITGIGSLVGAINFIVTVVNMRAPGMRLMRMPVFTWMITIISFLLLFALPVITVALIEVFFDREYGTAFFDYSRGGEPLLWQHLFWLFGHPEVYVLILPAMGIVSEILPTFARKPLFGYSFVVFSGAAIGFMGWGVWAHHMFASGLGPVAVTAFSLSTMFIAVPTGVKIFNWVGTMWGGAIRLRPPMAFAIAFIVLFVIGGLSGVTHAFAASDRQQTDTYYVVAHFHYVLFGGAMFGLIGGAYFYFPKMFGRLMNERVGWLNFWLMFIGMNMTFGPMHIIGLEGQPRRTYTYPEGMGWDTWNMVATIGSFILALSFVTFLGNWIWSLRRGPVAGDDPWDARTLEWSIPSPPPEYNFAVVPHVQARDDWWHQKYTEDADGRLVRRISGASDDDPGGGGGGTATATLEHGGPGDHDAGHDEHGDGEHIHMPSPSYHPLLVGLGLPFLGYGFIDHWFWFIPGGFFLAWGIVGWLLEPASE
jgi:cytochrome c oxidase subunit 1